MVPFHILTIKNATNNQEGEHSYIRLIFNFGQSFEPGSRFPKAVFLKELSFRTTDSRHALKVVQEIKVLRSSVSQREREQAERANLVQQERLVKSKVSQCLMCCCCSCMPTSMPVCINPCVFPCNFAATNGLAHYAVSVTVASLVHAMHLVCEIRSCSNHRALCVTRQSQLTFPEDKLLESWHRAAVHHASPQVLHMFSRRVACTH